jgi:MFS family permease
MAAASPITDSFAPLRQSAFAVLWAATVLGNTGTFMRDVASAWLVTDLSASPMAVALIQVAGTLPIFLLAIPAGVLSDILDRRRLLIGIQVLLAAVSATLMVLAHTQLISVSSLIALTLLGGIGAALMGPAWQSIVPELVPRTDLRNAVALNSLGINISRSIGPALGGLLLATFGAALTYGVDVLSYVLVVSALLWWRRPAKAADELPELASTLLIGAAGLIVFAVVLHRYKLPSVAADLMPSNHWAEPLVAAPVEADRGPVFVFIHYRVRQEDRTAFLNALARLSEERRRDGASAWGVTEDANEPTHLVEWFVVESWAEHLRQHKRVSHADADVQRELVRYQVGGQPPTVEHFLALDVQHAAGAAFDQRTSAAPA